MCAENKSNKKRNKVIDGLKGIAIICVVLGHAIVVNFPETYKTNFIFKICYSFHMPLFMVLSSYIVGMKPDNYINNGWMKKRTIRQMVPNVLWTIISMIYYKRTNLFYYLFVDPFYWFLSCLWIYNLILFLGVKMKKNKLYFIIGMYFIVIILNKLFQIPVLVNLVLYYPFYFAGIYFYKIYSLRKNLLEKVSFVCAILYPVSFLIYSYTMDPSDAFININELLQLEKMLKLKCIFSGFNIVFSKYIVAVLGICFFTTIIRCLSKFHIGDGLCSLGQFTMTIYLLHMLIIRIVSKPMSHNSVIVSIFFEVTISLACSIMIYKLTERSKKMHYILWGA